MPDTQDQPTQPHVDACPDCSSAKDGKWRVLAYAAEREEPGEYGGYVAFYRCERGHHWHTGWADETRLSPHEIDETVKRSREMFETEDQD